jgi:hypothetical protein
MQVEEASTLVPDVVVQQIIEPPIIADAEVAIAPSTHVDFTAVATDVEAQAFRSTETSLTATIEEPQAKKVRRSRGEKVPRWTSEEEERLRALVGQNGDRAWVKVAEALGTGRTPAGVDQHWQIMSGKRKRNGKKAESMPLAATAVTTYGEGGVVVVPEATGVVVTSFDLSSSEQGGSLSLIEGVAVEKEKKTRTRRSSGKILRWTPEEEAKLKRAVEEKGVRGQWQAIADELGTGRTPAGVDQHWQIMSGRRKRYAQQSSKARVAAVDLADGDDGGVDVSGGVEVVSTVVEVVDSSMAAAQPPTLQRPTLQPYSDASASVIGDAEPSAPASAPPVYVTAPVYAAPVTPSVTAAPVYVTAPVTAAPVTAEPQYVSAPVTASPEFEASQYVTAAPLLVTAAPESFVVPTMYPPAAGSAELAHE